MSWKMINRILGLASINPNFQQQLQQNPLAAIEVYKSELTLEELEAFRAFASLPFPQFCERLRDTLTPDEKYS